MATCLNVSPTASFGKHWLLNTDSNIRNLCKIFVEATRTVTKSSKEEMATEEDSAKSETNNYGEIKSQ